MQANSQANSLKFPDENWLDQVIRQAGDIALEFFNSSAKKWDKSDGTPVTEADIAVDEFLKAALLKGRPDYGWLSEETTDSQDRLACSKVWIVDPIDGTSAFVKGTDEWCISAALLVDDKIVLAKVFRPVADEMYSAVAGEGATLNDKIITATDCRELQNCHMMSRKNVLAPERWAKAWPSMEVGITISLALRLCAVADGSFDGAISMGKESDWDLAAADLIIREAGGLITNVHGKPIVYNQPDSRQSQGVVAAGKTLHEQMLGVTQSFIK